MTVYAPGTEETDLKKIVMSLQQNAGANTTNTTNVATNTASIATNTAAIATHSTDISAIQAILSNVVQTVDTTNRSTTSTTFVTSSVAVTITPHAASSKVLLSVSGLGGAAAPQGLFVTIFRGSTDLTPSGNTEMQGFVITADTASQSIGFSFEDSPATTSATTYTIYFRSNAGVTVYLGRRGFDTLFDSPTIITAQEVRG